MKKLIRSFLLVLCTSTFLLACATTTPENVSEVKTDVVLNEKTSSPLPIKVAYYFPYRLFFERSNIEAAGGNYSFAQGYSLEKSLEFVVPSFFEKAQPLKQEDEFSYLFVFASKLKTQSTGIKFKYTVDLDMKVVDSTGQDIFRSAANTETSALSATDEQALINAFNQAIKENIVHFLNSGVGEQVRNQPSATTTHLDKLDIKQALDMEKPTFVGSGFYINESGQMLTSSHILKDCLYIETRQADVLSAAKIINKSVLLDVSVIGTQLNSASTYASFRAPQGGDLQLGEDMFTIGYPLADLLSSQPNLTTGNVSSLGALKGSKGFFQFTAPIQPGSSGSPVLAKQGQLLGMVSSTLNLQRSKSIPQNVNFAVNGDIMMKYLTNKGVKFYQDASSLEYGDAIKASNGYTAQVACYK